MAEDSRPGSTREPHDEVLARLARRVRLLATAHVSPDRVEGVVGGTLAELATVLRDGALAPDEPLSAAAYRMARRRIGTAATPETFRVAALLIEGGDRAEVARCLKRLDAADRAILRRAFVDGRSPAEIATAEGLTTEEVQRQKERAVDRFLELYHPSAEP